MEGNNLTRFASTRNMEEQYESEVLPFQISIGMRSASSDLCHSALMRLTGSAALKVLGLRVRPGRAARQPCAKALEQAYLSTPFCDWQQRDVGKV